MFVHQRGVTTNNVETINTHVRIPAVFGRQNVHGIDIENAVFVQFVIEYDK